MAQINGFIAKAVTSIPVSSPWTPLGQSLSLAASDNVSNISQMRPVRLVAKLQIVAGLRAQFGSLLAIILWIENNCLTSFPAHSKNQ